MGFGGTGWATPVGQIDVEGARKQVGLARDAGVNLFDTADVYSNGLSEEILGKALGSDRDEVLIATKVRGSMGDGPNDAGLSRHHVIRGAEASSASAWHRLHRPLPSTRVGWADSARGDATSTRSPRTVRQSALRRLLELRRLASHESAVDRRSQGSDTIRQQPALLLAAGSRHRERASAGGRGPGLGILVWSPIAGGLLSGKYRRGVEAPAGSRHLTEWNEPPVYDEDKLYDTVEELVAIGADHGVSAAQVALAYTMGKPAVTSVIVGARTEDQLADNLAAADLRLSATRWLGWTRSARSRCRTRTGTTPKQRATASAQPISRCWPVTSQTD